MTDHNRGRFPSPLPPDTPFPKPALSAAEVFHILFSNDQVAQWLLSKETEPPTALTYNMMKRSITTDGVAAGSVGEAAALARMSTPDIERDAPTSRSSYLIGFSGAEKLVYVCHGSTETVSFMTFTDSRQPFAFLETLGKHVPGVKRVVAIRRGFHVILAVYYWLQDGRSSITALYYSLSPEETTSEKYLYLLASYPSSRYPRPQDILETALMWEQIDCQFCLFRGHFPCECSFGPQPRPKAMHLANDHLFDMFSTFCFLWGVYDAGLKRYKSLVINHRTNIRFAFDGMFFLRPTFNGVNQQDHIAGYRHYLQSVAPYVASRMISLAAVIPSNALIDSGKPSIHASARPKDKQGRELGEVLDSVADMSERIMALPENANIISSSKSNASDSSPKKEPPALYLSVLPHPPSQTAVVPQVAAVVPPATIMDQDEEYYAEEEEENCVSSDDQANMGINEKLDAVHFSPVNHSSGEGGSSSHDTLCKVCGKMFTRRHDLKRHIRKFHLKQFDFRCQLCNAQYDRRQRLELHIKQVHENLGRFPCSLCKRTFANTSSLKRHVQNLHPQDGGEQPQS